MAKPARTGTLETCRDTSGRTYYRAKIRLEDGSRVRVEIPEAKCYSKTAARDFVSWAQENEDRSHTLMIAKREGLAKRGPRDRKPNEDQASYIRYLVNRCRRLEEALARRGVEDPDSAQTGRTDRHTRSIL